MLAEQNMPCLPGYCPSCVSQPYGKLLFWEMALPEAASAAQVLPSAVGKTKERLQELLEPRRYFYGKQ